ncbi:ATP-binding cassette sub-family B member 8, mitochondrial-like isoform X2 [Limulus polyphemus]|uniref:ATP-binding cassette sub-family B member 8, mitochondrial-like isoform X2 n=1 Tax=Limulus polyphemus TaxID=6850 RepID=A0ABM1TJ62_LIMPO|nr:ATP-binding cassette sub-family B member 8, mitochondrial-like isoform X2 [Limulus polyphemus]
MSHLWLISRIMSCSRFYSVKKCMFLHSLRIPSLVPCEGHWYSLIYLSAKNVKSFCFKQLLTTVNKLPTKKFRKLVTSPLLNYGSIFFTGAVLVHSRKNITYVYCESLQKPKRRQGKQKYNEMFDQKESEPQFDWQMFFHFLKPEMWFIIVAVVSAFVVALLNTKIPSLLGDVINVVSRFTRNGGSLDDKTDFLQTVKGPAVHLVYLYLVQSIFTFVYISTLSCAGERLACRIRQELFASILRQDVTFFDAHRTGEIVSRLTIDVQDFKSSFKMCISQGFRSFTQTAGCVISLYLISPKMTAIMLVAVPAIILTGTTLGAILRKVSKLAQEQGSYAAAVADEAVGNIRTVRAFAMEYKEEELYNHETEEVRKLNTSLGIGIGAFQGLTNLALNGIVLGVMYIGGSLMSSNELSPGSLMSFLVATQTIQRTCKLSKMKIERK